MISRGILVLAASSVVGRFLETVNEVPPRHKAASFTIDQAMEKMEEAASGAHH
jgi:arylsulfatase